MASLRPSNSSGGTQRPAAAPAPIALRGRVSAMALAPGEGGAAANVGDSPVSGNPSAAGDTAGEGRLSDDSPQPEEPVPFDPTPAGPPARASAARPERPTPTVVKGNPEAADLPDLNAETWVLAPIRWGGNSGTSGNYFQGSDDSKVLGLTNSLDLQANSFIVAPYIAQWSGVFATSSTNSSYMPKAGSDTKSESNSLNLGGSVNVFPLSRFPFSANINHSRSDSVTGGTSSPTNSTMLGAQQQYRSEDGRDNYSMGFNRTSLTSGGSGTDYGTVMYTANGSYSTSGEFEIGHLLEGNHSLSANVSMSSATADFYEQSFRGFGATVSHGWTVHEDLSINNMLTLARTDISTLQGSVLALNDSTVILGTTGFTWRPYEDLPLTFIGGGNFSLTQTDNFGQTIDFQNVGGFIATSYRFDNNLSASASANLNSSSGSGSSSVTSSQSGSISYSGDPLTLMNFSYGWGAGAGISAYTSSIEGGGIGANLSASHNLGRALVLNEANAITLNASQSLSYGGGGSQQGTTISLSHSAGATWQARYGEQLTTNLSANLSNSINKEETGDSTMFSASLTGGSNYQISSRAALWLNVNLNWSKWDRDADTQQALNGLIIDTAAPQKSGSLSVGYSHQSPFSIPNLNYTASLIQTDLITTNQRLVGTVRQPNEDLGTTSFQQALTYQLGRLSFRLDNFVIDQAGRKSASVFGSINRQFDGFFSGRW